MHIELLIACRNESLGQSLCEQFARAANGISTHTTELAKLHVRVAAGHPDVLLLQHSKGNDATDQVVHAVRQLSPTTRVLLLCETYSHDLVVSFIKLGVSGCVLESDEPALMAKAVRAVHEEDTWFGRSALLHALRSLIGPTPTVRAIEEGRLTHREEEIFNLVGRALTNKEIARQLEISDHTVKTHLHRIYVKLRQSGRYKALLLQPNRPAN
jgi:DNA-binding NarL/FixJ family response regulator